LVKNICSKPTLANILDDERLNACSLRPRTRQGCPRSALMQHTSECSSHCNQAGQGDKRPTDWKVRNKIALIVDDIVSIEDLNPC
jgi:hypothetical protein